MTEPTPFQWHQAMRFAFGRLRLSPQAFWSMTLHELNQAMMAHSQSGPCPLQRSELEELMQQHPDRK